MPNLVPFDPQKHIKKNTSPQPETDSFWYICGLIVLVLTINSLSHLVTGEGILYHL